jgi:hypothetical protein
VLPAKTLEAIVKAAKAPAAAFLISGVTDFAVIAFGVGSVVEYSGESQW